MKHFSAPIRWLTSLVLLLAVNGSVIVAAQSLTGTVTNTAGQVTISATPTVGTDELTFAVILDTHVVNLDAYDLLELAVVRTVDEREIAPLQWDAPPGGHHREGTLRFPLISQDGVAVLESGSGGVALVIRDMAGVPERVLEWSW